MLDYSQSLGARLPVLDTKETIDIVKSYLDKADPEELKALEEWDQSSRRVWLGLNFNPGSGKERICHRRCPIPCKTIKFQPRAYMG